ncbi:MAG TPA: D-Ala-D-Ala carboxypeptidase family metallohydrolase [Sphingomicrobium sp.]
MTRFGIGALLLCGASAAGAQSTDFGVRTVSGERAMVVVAVAPKVAVRADDTVKAYVSHADTTSWTPIGGGSGSLSSAANLGSRWGRVTSTLRSIAHNRAVGGVPNSYHLRGRAIDIARRPGVTHAMIAAAFRSAGYRLVESLDEGDHSHFAFAWGGSVTQMASLPQKSELTKWGVVTVSASLLR